MIRCYLPPGQWREGEVELDEAVAGKRRGRGRQAINVAQRRLDEARVDEAAEQLRHIVVDLRVLLGDLHEHVVEQRAGAEAKEFRGQPIVAQGFLEHDQIDQEHDQEEHPSGAPWPRYQLDDQSDGHQSERNQQREEHACQIAVQCLGHIHLGGRALVLRRSDRVGSYRGRWAGVSGSVEEQLWTGTLPEGLYRFRAPLKKITSGPLRVILKAKMTNLDAKGNQTFYSYQRWEGSIGR